VKVSVKGVLLVDDRVALVRNERDEWELPGGRLEAGEDPPDCVEREVREELGLSGRAGALLDVWRYVIDGAGEVLIVTYAMEVASFAGMRCSDEHSEARAFGVDEVPGLRMPGGYKASVARARQQEQERRRARPPGTCPSSSPSPSPASSPPASSPPFTAPSARASRSDTAPR
jgi:8-oxo-dGTP pyrophosphatase MutT (NUDIX family)